MPARRRIKADEVRVGDRISIIDDGMPLTVTSIGEDGALRKFREVSGDGHTRGGYVSRDVEVELLSRPDA
jgi:hypothetical protein